VAFDCRDIPRELERHFIRGRHGRAAVLADIECVADGEDIRNRKAGRARTTHQSPRRSRSMRSASSSNSLAISKRSVASAGFLVRGPPSLADRYTAETVARAAVISPEPGTVRAPPKNLISLLQSFIAS
jgi:hypothetical protein